MQISFKRNSFIAINSFVPIIVPEIFNIRWSCQQKIQKWIVALYIIWRALFLKGLVTLQ